MRTLIIDNYDSFTYNLCHLVGAVTGVAPVVVRNDESVDLDGYSHVILSPGPGRPERAGDFGVCAEVIRRATVPLLGVCLGHQGICHVYGGGVGPAPRVRHGETSPIHHDGTGLFAGLPSPFEAVRYHSLVVTGLPDVLEPVAYADDGVLMAVRHRERPQWGVQFHPESIRTEYGHRLLANFLGEPWPPAPDFQPTGEHRQSRPLNRQPATDSPTEPERMGLSCGRGAPDFHSSTRDRQFRPVGDGHLPWAGDRRAPAGVDVARRDPGDRRAPAGDDAVERGAGERDASASDEVVGRDAGERDASAGVDAAGRGAGDRRAATGDDVVGRDAGEHGASAGVDVVGRGAGERGASAGVDVAGRGAGEPGAWAADGLRTPATPRCSAPRSTRTIAHRRLRIAASAETVFDNLYAGADHAFWLDSAAGGRFSILGDASGPEACVATADVVAGTVTIRSADQDVTIHSGFLDWLADDLALHRVAPPDLPFDFALGWVGYLGYELKAECGSPNAHRSEDPDAAMIFADRAIVFDHQENDVHLLALTDDGWFDEIEATLRNLADQPAEPPAPDLGPLRSRHDRAAYLDLIAACQREIIAGETYEVCLTNQIVADGKLDPWLSYRRLRRANPEPFCALLRFGELSVLSASPERFLSVTADGVAESKPIKGTRPRGTNPAEDEALRRDLAASAKDRAENLMIVDLVRNDLGSVAEHVEVSTLYGVETHPTVHQLVSTVHARLREDRTAVDAIRAAFPGGSMTGAPKLRTMEIIDRLEGGPRGVYSGALGYFSLSGAADLSIVIRTLVASGDRVSYGVGGAVIALSTPDDEMAETVVKAAPLLRLVGQDFPGEKR